MGIRREMELVSGQTRGEIHSDSYLILFTRPPSQDKKSQRAQSNQTQHAHELSMGRNKPAAGSSEARSEAEMSKMIRVIRVKTATFQVPDCLGLDHVCQYETMLTCPLSHQSGVQETRLHCCAFLMDSHMETEWTN
ncbi:Uncharacterized protein DAT39_002905 [Clarias magur]|uniref:Uncharacterized protein n=1 Tax=Clarias magur TaxID=1594786 RepID=A0A8J4XF10_CLAMG|nr:Uncharacterized protein DAT39_002905 [Clarias magur]